MRRRHGHFNDGAPLARNAEGAVVKELRASLDGELVLAHLAPAGEFEIELPAYGGGLTSFTMTAAVAREIIRIDASWTNLTPVDYDFQTLLSAENGETAPAAGWISSMHWNPTRGLFATVELLPRAIERVRERGTQWIAPFFAPSGDPHPKRLMFASLVDRPAIDGVDPVRMGALTEESVALTMTAEQLGILRMTGVSVGAFARSRRRA